MRDHSPTKVPNTRQHDDSDQNALKDVLEWFIVLRSIIGKYLQCIYDRLPDTFPTDDSSLNIDEAFTTFLEDCKMRENDPDIQSMGTFPAWGSLTDMKIVWSTLLLSTTVTYPNCDWINPHLSQRFRRQVEEIIQETQRSISGELAAANKELKRQVEDQHITIGELQSKLIEDKEDNKKHRKALEAEIGSLQRKVVHENTREEYFADSDNDGDITTPDAAEHASLHPEPYGKALPCDSPGSLRSDTVPAVEMHNSTLDGECFGYVDKMREIEDRPTSPILTTSVELEQETPSTDISAGCKNLLQATIDSISPVARTNADYNVDEITTLISLVLNTEVNHPTIKGAHAKLGGHVATLITQDETTFELEQPDRWDTALICNSAEEANLSNNEEGRLNVSVESGTPPSEMDPESAAYDIVLQRKRDSIHLNQDQPPSKRRRARSTTPVRGNINIERVVPTFIPDTSASIVDTVTAEESNFTRQYTLSLGNTTNGVPLEDVILSVLQEEDIAAELAASYSETRSTATPYSPANHAGNVHTEDSLITYSIRPDGVIQESTEEDTIAAESQTPSPDDLEGRTTEGRDSNSLGTTLVTVQTLRSRLEISDMHCDVSIENRSCDETSGDEDSRFSTFTNVNSSKKGKQQEGAHKKRVNQGENCDDSVSQHSDADMTPTSEHTEELDEVDNLNEPDGTPLQSDWGTDTPAPANEVEMDSIYARLKDNTASPVVNETSGSDIIGTPRSSRRAISSDDQMAENNQSDSESNQGRICNAPPVIGEAMGQQWNDTIPSGVSMKLDPISLRLDFDLTVSEVEQVIQCAHGLIRRDLYDFLNVNFTLWHAHGIWNDEQCNVPSSSSDHLYRIRHLIRMVEQNENAAAVSEIRQLIIYHLFLVEFDWLLADLDRSVSRHKGEKSATTVIDMIVEQHKDKRKRVETNLRKGRRLAKITNTLGIAIILIANPCLGTIIRGKMKDKQLDCLASYIKEAFPKVLDMAKVIGCSTQNLLDNKPLPPLEELRKQVTKVQSIGKSTKAVISMNYVRNGSYAPSKQLPTPDPSVKSMKFGAGLQNTSGQHNMVSIGEHTEDLTPAMGKNGTSAPSSSQTTRRHPLPDSIPTLASEKEQEWVALETDPSSPNSPLSDPGSPCHGKHRK